MRRLEYWKTVETSKPWSKFDLVPLQVYQDNLYFDDMVAAVKAAGFDYRIIETTEKLLESS